jgi:hypothetical protein
LSREEDRIENELPGLREAAFFCNQIAEEVLALGDVNRIIDHLRKIGVRNPEQLRDLFNTRLPETDDRTRRILIADVRKLFKLVLSAQILLTLDLVLLEPLLILPHKQTMRRSSQR